MFDKIKRLGTDTAIYGISTILGRFLNFLLVPFYTNILPPGDYGVVAYVYSIIAFINVLYSYGMESAYFKYSSSLEIGSAKENFSTPFLSLLGTSVLFSIVISGLAPLIGGLLNLPLKFESVVLYSAAILALDALAIIPFASLRMERKAKTFATIKFLNIVINVGMNIVLLLVFRMGVMGVFVSGLVASGATLLMLLPTVFRHLTVKFHTSLWKALLMFGLPYIPSGLSAMAMQVIDRPILRALTDDATVGVYQANYRLGIFMMLVVSMYDYAWRPFFFATAKESDAKNVFARVLTYLLLFMATIGLVLTFFIDNIAMVSIFGRHIIGPSYWSGLNIVPVVLFGYVFLGVATNLSAGLYIQKKTQYLPIATFIGAVVNVVVNFLLIPVCGMTGAAWATFLAYLAQAAATYVLVQRVYPVRYEGARLIKIAGAAMLVLALYYLIPVARWSPSFLIHAGWKVGLVVIFLLMMYAMKFFEPREIVLLKRMVARGKAPGHSTPAPGLPPDGNV